MSIDDGSASSATLKGLSVGVAYSVMVQANGDIPGPVSDAMSITLNGRLRGEGEGRGGGGGGGERENGDGK